MRRGLIRSQRGRARRVAVIGAGPAGLSAALACCELNIPVTLVSSATPRTTGSVRVHDGIAAAVGVWGDDDVETHFRESVREAGFLLHQAPIRAMVAAAPGVVAWLDRVGVPFARTSDGALRQRLGAGSGRRRVAYTGLDTGRVTRDVLDDQLRRWESMPVSDGRGAAIPGERMVHRLDGWELIELVRDDAGTAIGFVARELRGGAIRAFAADAVCLASGPIFPLRTGGLEPAAAAGVALAAGALATGMDRVEPAALCVTGLRGERPLGDGLLSVGARLWTTSSERGEGSAASERDYLLEGFSTQGLPGPAALAQAVMRACQRGGVYLDATHLDPAEIGPHVPRGEATAYRCPRLVAPSLVGSLGGLWVDHEVDGEGTLVAASARNHSTSIAGLYAAGDCVALYRGSSELSGNGLMSAIFGARLAARALAIHRESLMRSAFDMPGSVFERAERSAEAACAACLEREGDENVFSVADELLSAVRRAMFVACRGSEHGDALEPLPDVLCSLRSRAARTRVEDKLPSENRAARLACQLDRALLVADMIAAALERRGRLAETAGSHLSLFTGSVGHGKTPALSFPAAHSYECVGRSVAISAAFDTRFFPASPEEVEGGRRQEGRE